MVLSGDSPGSARALRSRPFSRSLTSMELLPISSGVRARQDAKNGAPGGSARGYRSHGEDPRVFLCSCELGGTCSIHMLLVIQLYTYIKLFLQTLDS